MAKTRIEWTDYSLNPIKGLCPVDCRDSDGKSYCYARRLYKRFGWNETIRFEPEVMLDASAVIKPSRFFVGSTMELFGPWVEQEWIRKILFMCAKEEHHTFLFLTKRPGELKKYNPWPDNCWVGTTVTNLQDIDRIKALQYADAKVRFVSFEPLQEWLSPNLRYVQWAIVGQRTPVRKSIPIEWVWGIVTAAIDGGNIQYSSRIICNPYLVTIS